MSKKVMVLSTGPRRKGNSDELANAFVKGAQAVGHDVEKVTLYHKDVQFCRGCLRCQATKSCIIKDDVQAILTMMKDCEVIVFATPVYFYQMCGQMKTFLDRTNPLFTCDYQFKDIYLLTSAADHHVEDMQPVVTGVKGWVDCFEKATLKGVIHAMDVTDIGDIQHHSSQLEKAYEMGKNS